MSRFCFLFTLLIARLTLSAYDEAFEVPIKHFTVPEVTSIVNTYLVDDTLPVPISSVKASLVFYETEDAGGADLWASGVLLKPTTSNGTIVSLQHSTIFGDQNAPSSSLIRSAFFGCTPHYNLQDAFVLASQGNTVVLADYLGFGASRCCFQTYLDFRMQATISRDLLTALAYSGYQGDLFLSGYSQGGHATMALLDSLQADPIPAMPVIGSAAGAGPHALTTILDAVLGLDLPGANIFIALFAVGAKENYEWDRPYSAIFRPEYAPLFPCIMDGRNDWDQVEALLPQLPSDLFTAEFIGGYLLRQDEEFLSVLVDTTIVVPQTPTLLWHSAGDTIVPVFNSQVAFAAYDAAGADVTLQVDEVVGDHLDADTLDAWTHAVLDRLAVLALASEG